MLRLWLVAYGVGGPVLLLSSSEVTAKVVASGQAYLIVVPFLLGVPLQVVNAALNKPARIIMSRSLA